MLEIRASISEMVENIWEKGISKYFGIGISWYFQIDKSQVCSMHIHQHAKCAPISMLQGTWHFNLKFSTNFNWLRPT